MFMPTNKAPSPPIMSKIGTRMEEVEDASRTMRQFIFVLLLFFYIITERRIYWLECFLESATILLNKSAFAFLFLRNGLVLLHEQR